MNYRPKNRYPVVKGDITMTTSLSTKYSDITDTLVWELTKLKQHFSLECIDRITKSGKLHTTFHVELHPDIPNYRAKDLYRKLQEICA